MNAYRTRSLLSFLATTNTLSLLSESLLDTSKTEGSVFVVETDVEGGDVDVSVRGRISTVNAETGKTEDGEWFDVFPSFTLEAGASQTVVVPSYYDELALFAKSAIEDTPGGIRFRGTTRNALDFEAVGAMIEAVDEDGSAVSPFKLSVSTGVQDGTTIPISGTCLFDSDAETPPTLFAVCRLASGGAADNAVVTLTATGDTTAVSGDGTSFLVFTPHTDGTFSFDAEDVNDPSGAELVVVVGPWTGEEGDTASKSFSFAGA